MPNQNMNLCTDLQANNFQSYHIFTTCLHAVQADQPSWPPNFLLNYDPFSISHCTSNAADSASPEYDLRIGITKERYEICCLTSPCHTRQLFTMAKCCLCVYEHRHQARKRLLNIICDHTNVIAILHEAWSMTLVKAEQRNTVYIYYIYCGLLCIYYIYCGLLHLHCHLCHILNRTSPRHTASQHLIKIEIVGVRWHI